MEENKDFEAYTEEEINEESYITFCFCEDCGKTMVKYKEEEMVQLCDECQKTFDDRYKYALINKCLKVIKNEDIEKAKEKYEVEIITKEEAIRIYQGII